MSTLNNSVYNSKYGRYTLGGQTEVSSFALEWWNRNVLASDPSDIVYFVEKKYENNPHLLGHVFYGDTGLWWIICLYNSILDPISEIVEGKLLLIPTIERLNSTVFLNSATGGIPTTRPTVR
jgi:hypothetical protein